MSQQKSKSSHRSFIDRIILAVAVVEPIFTIPQVYVIFKDRDASGISITTWIGFNILTIIWIWYAIEHKDKIVLIYQGLFFLFNTLVIIGAIIYGGQWM
jgi:uncharacterized protein with PQ loop repeat